MYSPENYLIAKTLFIHGLGLIFFFAFFPFLFQIKGLIGQNGILPAKHYLQNIKKYLGKSSYYKVPTLFWIDASDKSLISVVFLGVICSILLFFGVYPPLMILILYILYLSIIHVGQDFLSFGWELFLMEISINAFFLSLTTIPNPFIWISINFLLFRFHLQAGAVKLLSGDPNWRNLTALNYHYLTQPIPNTIAWYFKKLPLWFQKFSCLNMFIIELILPFGVFGNELMRLFVFLGFFGLQFFIWFTGNFSYLNYMTSVLSIILISDSYFRLFLEMPFTSNSVDPLMMIISGLGGVVLFTFQLISLWNHFFPNQLFVKFLKILQPFFCINRYGIFAVMTTERHEIVIKGSDDGVNWSEYLFKYKPSEVSRRPRRIAPYQPRLDWQIWFIPLRHGIEDWFQLFLIKLLKGEKTVLKLMRYNPFPNKPPKYIQAHLYDYNYTNFETKRRTGNWWERSYLRPYSAIYSLKENSEKS